jgi:Bacterial Ig domain
MHPYRTFTLALAVGAAALLAATACGSNGYGSSGSSSGGSKPTLKIASPAAGATVSTPFTLKVTASVPLGPTDSGKDHIHLFLDGSSHYQVVTSARTQVKNLSPGEHTILVTLQHADHSPVGPKAKITVTVTGGSGPTPSSSSSSGGYGY